MPKKGKAERNESDDYSFPPEVVDNATGNDLPDNNTAAEDLKEENQDAAKDLAQGPKKKPASDGDDGSSSSSGLGCDGEGVGGSSGSRGRRSRAPDQGLIHSSAKPILRVFTHLGIEKYCAIRMINVE